MYSLDRLLLASARYLLFGGGFSAGGAEGSGGVMVCISEFREDGVVHGLGEKCKEIAATHCDIIFCHGPMRVKQRRLN